MNIKIAGRTALVGLAVLASASVFADAFITNDFESEPLGAVPGGADGRLPGNGLWYSPDNSATYGIVKDGIGIGGSRGIEIGNRGNGFDGVIDNVKSAQLLEAAGESSVATNSQFNSSYWFRTADTVGYAYDGSQGTAYRFRSETWGPDRTTFFGVENDASGNLFAWAAGMDASGNFEYSPDSVNLTWGEWYRVETSISFVDGGGANDVVTYSIFDSLNNQIYGATLSTWEEGARQLGYNGGNIFAVDAVGFQARYGRADALGATFVDGMHYEAVPEPFTIGILAAGGALLARRRRKA